jgi:uncharacterized protein
MPPGYPKRVGSILQRRTALRTSVFVDSVRRMPTAGRAGPVAGLVGLLLAAALAGTASPVAGAPDAPAPAPAPAAAVARDLRVETSDGVSLLTRLGGVGPLVDGQLPPRPVIVEFSPYGPGCCAALAGPEYNYLQVHIRGTGQSDGAFDALGPRTQRDVVEVLDWACRQPWSNGRIGLYGFSASAITVYNSLHLELPCVETAVLGAGTHELYRDLMYPGGIPNLVPAIGVLALIGAPSIQAGPDRLGRNPLSVIDTLVGMFDTGFSYVEHPTLDGWWRERGMRGDANDLPILMVTGFYDVESRGPFQAFQELRDDGAHLMVVGAHDGVPAGSGGSDATRQRWFDRFLRDVDNGVDREPAVQLWMSDGDRVDMLGGRFVRAEGDDWPIPGTRWASLALDAARSGTATSLNDGSLVGEGSPAGPAPSTRQSYLSLPSLPTATDPHTTSLLGFANGSPSLTDMTLAEPLGLSYTTAPFATDVVSAGPASLELVLSTTTPGSDIYAVLSDVWPDGTAHPVATGRLRTTYPAVDEARSIHDDTGSIVQPYGRFDQPRPPAIGVERRYHVELWPIGNRFRAKHRLRLHLVGASAFQLLSLPGLHSVRVGGADGSRLLLPVLPGSDIDGALAGTIASRPAGPDGEGGTQPTVPDGRTARDAGTSGVGTAQSKGAGALPATGRGSTPGALVVAVLLAAVVVRRVLGAGT